MGTAASREAPKKTMRLTTAEMTKLSGIAYRTMQDIEQERSDGSVQTMSRWPNADA
jgi:DNA-binding XRE family transcriptional regulator